MALLSSVLRLDWPRRAWQEADGAREVQWGIYLPSSVRLAVSPPRATALHQPWVWQVLPAFRGGVLALPKEVPQHSLACCLHVVTLHSPLYWDPFEFSLIPQPGCVVSSGGLTDR
jgi:hypothetical protein